MNDTFARLLLAFLVLAVSLPSQAVVVEGLFSAEVPVADQTSTARIAAFADAFKQVVIKATGSEDVLGSPGLARPLKSSARYVRQFRYINRDEQDAEGVDFQQLYLKIDFNQSRVETLLRDNKISVWGRERPASLMVVSHEANRSSQLVSEDTTPDLIDMLDEAAAKWGVPILFPLMDLADISLVSVEDITWRQYENIDILAGRYDPGAVVVGQISMRGEEAWSGDWEVRFEAQVFKWQYEGSSRQQIVDQVIKRLARILALEFALEDRRRVERELVISVSSLSELSQLILVQAYLESLSVVDSARIGLISDDVVTFKLVLHSDEVALQGLIENDRVLEQLDLPHIDVQGEGDIILKYYYTGRGVSD